MKVVIQNRTTGDYVGTSGEWTSDPDRSFDFEKTMLAFQYCRDSNLTEADVIFKFEDSSTISRSLLIVPSASKVSRIDPRAS